MFTQFAKLPVNTTSSTKVAFALVDWFRKNYFFKFEQFDWLMSKLILLSPNQNAYIWEISFGKLVFPPTLHPPTIKWWNVIAGNVVGWNVTGGWNITRCNITFMGHFFWSGNLGLKLQLTLKAEAKILHTFVHFRFSLKR